MPESAPLSPGQPATRPAPGDLLGLLGRPPGPPGGHGPGQGRRLAAPRGGHLQPGEPARRLHRHDPLGVPRLRPGAGPGGGRPRRRHHPRRRSPRTEPLAQPRRPRGHGEGRSHGGCLRERGLPARFTWTRACGAPAIPIPSPKRSSPSGPRRLCRGRSGLTRAGRLRSTSSGPRCLRREARGPRRPRSRPRLPRDVERTLEISRAAFSRAGLGDAWDRVIAVVVQPGVEFGDFDVHPYDRAQARRLSGAIAGRAPWMYEAHSTDYQHPRALRRARGGSLRHPQGGPVADLRLPGGPVRPGGRRPRAPLGRPGPPGRPAPRDARPGHAEEPRPLEEPPPRDRGGAGPGAALQLQRPLPVLLDRPGGRRERSLASSTSWRAPIPVQLISQHFPLALDAVLEGSLEPDGPSLVTHAIRRVLGHYAAACRGLTRGGGDHQEDLAPLRDPHHGRLGRLGRLDRRPPRGRASRRRWGTSSGRSTMIPPCVVALSRAGWKLDTDRRSIALGGAAGLLGRGRAARALQGPAHRSGVPGLPLRRALAAGDHRPRAGRLAGAGERAGAGSGIALALVAGVLLACAPSGGDGGRRRALGGPGPGGVPGLGAPGLRHLARQPHR